MIDLRDNGPWWLKAIVIITLITIVTFLIQSIKTLEEEEVTIKLNIGTNRFTEVIVLDKPMERNNACHEYEVRRVSSEGATLAEGDHFAKITFQKGPVGENKVSGIHNEDLYVILIDRLEGFQHGEFACPENEQALINLKQSLYWLQARTHSRIRRGVDGKNEQ